MARIEFALEVADDVDRIVEHRLGNEARELAGRVAAIAQAIDVLGQSPLIGRPLRGGLRELVIGRRSHGYVALYRYIAEIDTVFVLAVRSQSEAGCQRQ